VPGEDLDPELLVQDRVSRPCDRLADPRSHPEPREEIAEKPAGLPLF